MNTNSKARQYIQDIVERLIRDYQPERIILFGWSYAYDQPDGDSDIDRLIVKDTDERLIDRMVRAREIAFDWNRDVPFEPIVYTPQEVERALKAGDPFLREIFEKGEVLYDHERDSLIPYEWFRKGDENLTKVVCPC